MDDLAGAPMRPGRGPAPTGLLLQTRTAAERDYDRLRFAAPVRRLADKTQVFPLEQNDSVRTRLTHSEEVSALARSLGTHLAHAGPAELRAVPDVTRNLPSVLAAIGLAHDLGNPPFGHQGEGSIRSWFLARPHLLGQADSPPSAGPTEKRGNVEAQVHLTEQMRRDFQDFEGNAQTLRLVTRLQSSTNGYGLNLTVATLASVMKYTAAADATEKNGLAGLAKVGFFTSEAELAACVRSHVGLDGNARHPLTLLLEACDDIAYSVIDAEDTVKKGLVSFGDLMAYLEAKAGGDEAVRYVVGEARADHEEARKLGRAGGASRQPSLTPAELNDVSMQKFRVHAIGMLVSAAVNSFVTEYEEIMQGRLHRPLLEVGRGDALVRAMKGFDFDHAFRNRDVLAVETKGNDVIHGLMSMLWRGIVEREDYVKTGSRRTSPFADLAYSHVSDNYRHAFQGDVACFASDQLPVRYRELQLLADMISGMTDTYAVDMHEKLGRFHVGANHRDV